MVSSGFVPESNIALLAYRADGNPLEFADRAPRSRRSVTTELGADTALLQRIDAAPTGLGNGVRWGAAKISFRIERQTGEPKQPQRGCSISPTLERNEPRNRHEREFGF